LALEFEPLGDRVLMDMDEDLDMNESGTLYIPDMAKERMTQGTVVSVGPGHWDNDLKDYRPLHVRPGDRVLIGKYAGTDIKLNDRFYSLTTEQDILGKLNEVEIEQGDLDGEAVSAGRDA
jgi:chaperonin GroES